MKKILCLIVLMFMASACARQPSIVPPADSADRWQAFVARSGAVKEAFERQFAFWYGGRYPARHGPALGQ